MASYHVACNADGTIGAGTINKKGGWINCTNATQEALEAVRDHLLSVSKQRGKDTAYCWRLANGGNIVLKLEITENVVEEEKQEPEAEGDKVIGIKQKGKKK